ncbi:hypothetical protein LOTGIDRAFT_154424 [Lottia gigantea]|uniref:Uncharacterized protein n=1 Tax=Lottia gigantea TaxID=225164 RepID=V3ZDX8_LOTGI|nr:hypothetical protein LOTGIDRAFT_154424 [Lottia gigantea]ESO89323.1 hypothetical protein LOTGIDRAFT_154424 [Lottia gigantea]
MNSITICVFVSVFCGIYGAIPSRGDFGRTNRNFKRDPQCYDEQLVKDQFFDDSFICYDNMTYPAAEISYFLDHIRFPQNKEYAEYLKLASICVKEQDYFSDHKRIVDEYSYDCVCKSPRRLISSVYYQNQRCHIVDNQRQGIYHATCGGPCALSYDSILGYHCINRGWVKRTFLVYCENNADAFTTYNHNLNFNNVPLGGFYYMTKEMPTYCGCRNYFNCRTPF